MDQQKLRPFVEAIKKDPQDQWAWLQLGDIAKMIKDWKTATCSYLAGIRLQTDDASIVKKFLQAREQLLETFEMKNPFFFEIFKLPSKTGVILLKGIMNTDLDALEFKVKALAKNKFSPIIFDFSGVKSISGLAPSFIRRIDEYLTQHKGKLILVNVCDDVNSMLQLKRIEVTQYPDIQEAFTAVG